MLGSYMEDIGMTPEQFENACSKNTAGGLHIRFHQVGNSLSLSLLQTFPLIYLASKSCVL